MTYWTDDRIESLKSLWQEGLSASQVACALGGVTRNAVIGKVHRLGLAGRDGAPRVSRPRAPAAPRLRAMACQPVVTVIEQDPFRFEDGSLATMRTIDKAMCRWPIGD
ncbi:MAG TPA: GcrA family cell cycle regulator, partial [Acetobacteraceae bacterium]|nr:GcrA family cell cycle regulator [Acetobacteraceae bacterium]